MVETEQSVTKAVNAVEQQAIYNVYESLVFIALETGNIPAARRRIKEAAEDLPWYRVRAIKDAALDEYGTHLD